MTQASKQPMPQTGCALATKQKTKDGRVQGIEERPRADLCDREWTVNEQARTEHDLVPVNTKRLATLEQDYARCTPLTVDLAARLQQLEHRGRASDFANDQTRTEHDLVPVNTNGWQHSTGLCELQLL